MSKEYLFGDVCWLILALELFNQRVVESVEPERFNVVVLVHKLDAAGDPVDHFLLRFVLRSEEAF